MRISFVITAAVSAAVILFAPHGAAGQPADAASCREAINGLISLLDSGKDNTALYRDTYDIVVNTCGPAAHSEKTVQSPQGRAACDGLAAAMTDLIEDDKMDTPAFADARDAFARTCAPK
jgi:hypothetical protein